MDMHARRNAEAEKRKQSEVRRLFIEPLESRQLLSASAADPIVTPSVVFASAASSSTTIAGYSPAQLKTAYGITGDGSGQTIAIVDAYSDPNIASDLAVFDARFGLSAPASFKQVSSTGSTTSLPAANAGWDTEIALDVEWAHAIAPKANIVLVDAATASLSSLMSAVNYARNISTVSVVSMSWGSSEFSGETSYDSYFSTPAGHIGITFVAASGDQGASGGAEWPAVSPDVLSVGGTTLTLSSTGAIASETAWSDSSGGSSYIETLPAQQSATGLRTRTSPDVSYDANPNTGVSVYDSVSYDGYVGWQEVGGTSIGAPQWAGIIAIADAARTAARAATLTTSQVLSDVYTIYANASSYSADFHDITSGSSLLGFAFGGFGFGGFGGFRPVYVSATTGYDSLTGVGSPKGSGLISALTSTTTASTAASTKTAVTTKTATAAAKRAVLEDVNPLESLLAFTNVQDAADARSSSVTRTNLPNIETATAAVAMAREGPSTTATSAGLLGTNIAQAGNGISAGSGSSVVYAASPAAAAPVAAVLDSGDSTESPATSSYGQQIARAMSLPAIAGVSSATTLLPEVGQVFRDVVQDVESDWAGATASLGDMNGSGAAIAVAIADAALLAYCFSNRARQKAAAAQSLFNDGQLIDQASPF